MAGGVRWSPAVNTHFPFTFRQAVRALLLANNRGLQVGPGAPPGGRLHLPEGVLLRVLELAARPLLFWVPQLCPPPAGAL